VPSRLKGKFTAELEFDPGFQMEVQDQSFTVD